MLLEQILAPENLRQAWKRVKQNKGAAGVRVIGFKTSWNYNLGEALRLSF